MKILKSLTFIIISVALLASCASKSTFKVSSDPEGAEVFVKNIGSKDNVKIGDTPLFLEEEDLKDHDLTDGYIVMEVMKEGYSPTKVLITEVISVDVDFTVSLKPTDKLENSKMYDQLSTKLFEVHRLIRSEQYGEALEMITKIKDEHPEMSVPHELEGSVHYLQDNLEKAFESFGAAYSKNPENTFSLRMKRIVREKLGN